MYKKILLTGIFTVFVCSAAYADPTHTSSTFPNAANGEYMQPDYTYLGAATYANTGVYSGSVTAYPQYEPNYYNISPGYYLPAGSEGVTTICPANSVCEGRANVTYNANTDQGIGSCSAGTNGEYTRSVQGSKDKSYCWRPCEIENMGTSFTTIAHATAVTGEDHYVLGNPSDIPDTCEATACENGYHVKAGNPNLMNLIGSTEADYYEAVNNNGVNVGTYSSGSETKNTFTVRYESISAKLEGTAACSRTSGVIGSTSESIVADFDSGKYCWCHLDWFGNTANETDLYGPWVFVGTRDYYETDCAVNCAKDCGNALTLPGEFRSAAFGALPLLASCEANTITITWNGAASPSAISANDAGTVKYGGDIRTPVAGAVVPGKTFTGWKFNRTSIVSQ